MLLVMAHPISRLAHSGLMVCCPVASLAQGRHADIEDR
jgi:hypothetical protein